MVKRQREKQYLSAREQRDNSQIRSGSAAAASYSSTTSAVQKRLPFSHCALTLTPYETPVCTRAGIVFENSAILPFILKHKMDPVSGEPMTTRDLITLHMEKDDETGQWACPVVTKPFANHTKIVAILQPNGSEANVYSYEAYQELNVKANNYEDLVSGEKFHKTKDVIVLNDPDNDEFNRKRDMGTFYHIQHARELRSIEEQQQKSSSNPNAGNVRHSKTASRIMEQLEKNNKEKEKSVQPAPAPAPTTSIGSSTTTEQEPGYYYSTHDGKKLNVLACDVTGVQYNTAKASTSFTSTATEVAYETENRKATLEEMLQSQFLAMKKLKKKGRVRLHITTGSGDALDLVLELHCDIAPRTCTNFLGLCKNGTYNGTAFHRLIPNFMLQGGKANENKKDGADDGAEQVDTSLWGGPFVDEFDERLKHSGCGVLSMANSGMNTNRQQFFITFKSCHHLDRKHSVFGNVVKGQEHLLQKLEKIPTDKKDRPKQEIKIISTEILADPAEEARALEQQRIEKLIAARTKSDKKKSPTATSSMAKPAGDGSGGGTGISGTTTADVGRYLKDTLKSSASSKAKKKSIGSSSGYEIVDLPVASRLKPPPKKTKFGDFKGW